MDLQYHRSVLACLTDIIFASHSSSDFRNNAILDQKDVVTEIEEYEKHVESKKEAFAIVAGELEALKTNLAELHKFVPMFFCRSTRIFETVVFRVVAEFEKSPSVNGDLAKKADVLLGKLVAKQKALAESLQKLEKERDKFENDVRSCFAKAEINDLYDF